MSMGKYFIVLAGIALLTGCASQRVTSHDFQYGVSPDKLNRLMGEANQDSGEQFLLLGSLYQVDRTVKDLTLSRHYYRLAAERGNAKAQYFLGKMLFAGKGGPKDYDEAFRWFGQAAEQGNREAQIQAGMIYYRFLDAPPDYVNAYKWLTLGGARDKVDQLESEMTSDQVIQAQHMARTWEPKAFQ